MIAAGIGGVDTETLAATMRPGLAVAKAVATATAHELREQQRLRATRDAEEGIRAVAERREGRFTNS